VGCSGCVARQAREWTLVPAASTTHIFAPPNLLVGMGQGRDEAWDFSTGQAVIIQALEQGRPTKFVLLLFFLLLSLLLAWACGH